MQESHFNNLTDEMVKKLADVAPEAFTQERATEQKIRTRMQELVSEGKLLSLTVEEVNLITDYNLWKNTNAAATGVFHWRVRR